MSRRYYFRVSAPQQFAIGIEMVGIGTVAAICAVNVKSVGWAAFDAVLAILCLILGSLAMLNGFRIIAARLNVTFGWRK